MMDFFKTFLIVFIKQLLFLVVFIISVISNSTVIIYVPTALIVIYLIFYFKHSKNIYNKMKIQESSFNLYYFISWIIMGSLIIYLLLTDSWLWNILPTTNGMFGGLEYILVPILLIIYLIVWGIVKIIIYIFKKSKKS